MSPLTRARALLPGWRAAVVCMVIGVLLTIAVSWVLAVGYGRVGGWKLDYRPLAFASSDAEVPSATLAHELARPSDGSEARFQSVGVGLGHRSVRTLAIVHHRFRRFGGGYVDGREIESRLWSHFTGLPFKGLRTDQMREGGNPPVSSPWHTGIELNNGARLPLRPIWPAFLANTAFYATLTWAVVLAVRTLRNRIRRKPGQCPHCRYNATGLSQCPECGTFLIVRSASKP